MGAPLSDIILSIITDSIFSYVSKLIKGWLRSRDLEPVKEALEEALSETFERVGKRHPLWASEELNANFFVHEGASILAQFFAQDGYPDPSELADRWADVLNNQQPEHRAFFTRELEPVAVDFLDNFMYQLKSSTQLQELYNSRSLEQTTKAVLTLKEKLRANKATYGTYRDYLRCLIEFNLYLDPRGTFQTQRQVQVRLDEIYIPLLAQEKPGEILELNEIIAHHNQVVILGDPGSGKTTLLRYLALKHAEALWNGHTEVGSNFGTAYFPILIRIVEYAESSVWKSKTFLEYILGGFSLLGCPVDGLADLLQTELEEGNGLLLLDGLDEFANKGNRLGIVKQIEDFAHSHLGKANHFVITSRIADYFTTPLSTSFAHFTIQEMDVSQIQRFLERWCQAVEDSQTSELPARERRRIARREVENIMRVVRTSQGIRHLAANPLLLRILALLYRTGAEIPRYRVELYKLASDTLARTWRTSQGIPESSLLKEEYLTLLLSKLAYWLLANKSTGIVSEQEIYQVLGEEWASLNDLYWDEDDPNPKIAESIRKFLMAVREHVGLIVEIAPKQYSFIQLSLEEYYAARYLVARNKTRIELIRQHLYDLAGKNQSYLH